ncbi:uncharacterized protein At1g76070-like [Neltuma alba]|uniref:uncharacterized protein At1g76070 n=1 Tax=Neltuma alba TaxID=207710 RepID=UPI0010A37CD3|nr:uncharacterized protein At1g76070 [Prosopis alba]XP_028794270.1 uncharacterized protein At1g76070-like [Prosopis alba]
MFWLGLLILFIIIFKDGRAEPIPTQLFGLRMMEKRHKLKNRMLKILPKAAAAVRVTFQNPPFSPGRDHTKRPENASRWFKQRGGPTVSMIPDEARTKPKDHGGSNIDSREPTSPKVSCMGQIKHKKKQIKKAKAKSMSLPKDVREVEQHSSAFPRIFHGARHPAPAAATAPAHAPPALGGMKRFASGRNALTEFDWKAHAPAVDMEHNGYFSDQDREKSDAEEEEVIIPFSAPIMVGVGCHGGGVPLQPRKEINLWKRRTMTPPRPLQLKPGLRAS